MHSMPYFNFVCKKIGAGWRPRVKITKAEAARDTLRRFSGWSRVIPHLRHLVVFCVLLGQMSESAREGRGDVAVPSSFAVVLSLPDHVARVEQCHLTEDNGPSPFLDLPVSLGQCKAELQNPFYSAAVLVTALVFRLTVLALFLAGDTILFKTAWFLLSSTL